MEDFFDPRHLRGLEIVDSPRVRINSSVVIDIQLWAGTRYLMVEYEGDDGTEQLFYDLEKTEVEFLPTL